MQLHIKNMVCDRCILIIRQQMVQFGLQVEEISLGRVTVSPDPGDEQLQQLSVALEHLGFQLLCSGRDQLVEQIKTQIIELVHYTDQASLKQSMSAILSDRLNKEYAYLSRVFSDAENITIEKFIIQQKIEKVKELLEYGELNMSEIAFRMGYSSSAHLSTQFKALTGLSPSKYRVEPNVTRKALDQLGRFQG